MAEALRSGGGEFWYAGTVRSPVSIALFFLLSGFFLFALLAAIEHSGKAAAIAGVCLVAVVCIIVFLTPVRLPEFLRPGHHVNGDVSTTTTATSTSPTAGTTVTTTAGPPTTDSAMTTTAGGATTAGGTTTTLFDLTPITGTGL